MLFPEHLRNDENEHGATQAASEKKIDKGIAGGGQDGLEEKCDHSR